MASIQGLDKLVAKLSALNGNVNKTMKQAVHQAAKRIQREAKLLAPVNDGALRNNIHAEVEMQGNQIEGRVFTTVDHAPYVEFGTGPLGMASHKEVPAAILSKLSYRQNGWWIHESQIDAKTAEKYHFVKRVTDNGKFYYTEGQPAQPFLYPALANNEKKIEAQVRKVLRDEIRRLSEGG